MSDAYLGKALEDAFVRSLFEISTKGSRILFDVLGDFIQRNLFPEVVIKICIYFVYRLIAFRKVVRLVVGCIRQQFDVLTMTQPIKHLKQANDTWREFHRIKHRNHFLHFREQAIFVKADSILAFLQ